MNKVVEILMRRNGMTEEEAREEVAYCTELMNEAIADGDFFEAEEIMLYNLGLEPDYIIDMLI